MASAVLLIPGFFGFGRFEGKQGQLEYFAGIPKIIAQQRPDLAGRIAVHEPAPTGSLDERIASLHDAVVDLLAGRPLRHNEPIASTDRVHLIGHSAGGVDAWLYTRPQFKWAGGPRPDQRGDTLARIGDVVTLSAPFKGTPIAKFARTERDVFLMVVYALTVLGNTKLGADTVAALIKNLLRGTNPGDQLSTISFALSSMRADHGDRFVDDVLAFFTRIVEDRQLLRDLTVDSMTKLNERLKSEGLNHARIRSYVSVSPKPPNFLSVSAIAELFSDLGELPQQALYSHLYGDTARDDTPGAPPRTVQGGLRLGDGLDAELKFVNASDGVVPITSQTLDGNAVGIVLGDHLDVTGHFGDGPQRNVFKTGANFDQARLQRLWTHIAQGLVG